MIELLVSEILVSEILVSEILVSELLVSERLVSELLVSVRESTAQCRTWRRQRPSDGRQGPELRARLLPLTRHGNRCSGSRCRNQGLPPGCSDCDLRVAPTVHARLYDASRDQRRAPRAPALRLRLPPGACASQPAVSRSRLRAARGVRPQRRMDHSLRRGRHRLRVDRHSPAQDPLFGHRVLEPPLLQEHPNAALYRMDLGRHRATRSRRAIVGAMRARVRQVAAEERGRGRRGVATQSRFPADVYRRQRGGGTGPAHAAARFGQPRLSVEAPA